MRINIAQPVVNEDPSVPKMTVTTASNVCSTEAYTITVPSKDNRYIAALTWGLSDEECDTLLELLAEARAKRLMAQEAAYETLHAKFGGAWNNVPVEDFEPLCGDGVHRFVDGVCRDCGDDE